MISRSSVCQGPHLTLIAGPIERVRLAQKDDALVQQQLGFVQKDADRLLKLVSELMDFRKVETDHLQLHVTEHDLVAVLNDIYLYFSEVARSKQITVTFAHRNEALNAWFDRQQMEKVVFNLLTNAYKFTPAGGEILLTLEQQADTILIRVTDNGRGIAPEYIDKLFENYFQAADHGVQNTGYGIGLALSKAIIERHKGRLTAESHLVDAADYNRTSFTITLLTGYRHLEKFIVQPGNSGSKAIGHTDLHNTFQQEEMLVPTDLDPGDTSAFPGLSTGDNYTILLVEDNPSLRSFVSGFLADRYRIIEVADGQAGWEAAIEQIPDLIISDVTMPELDGMTLCSQLKTDERTSHIPVILLTARNTTANQVNGLALGADCYLTKPFSLQVLELYVRNLLVTRELMRTRFSRQVTLQPQNTDLSLVDEQFLGKLMQILEGHIDNSDFDVDQLATEVGMSRSVLYKKLKALTDMSVNDFVKSFRLEKASQLLQQKKMTVNEVAYAVGFNDRKYFSKEFKKKFGVAPSEYSQLSEIY